VESPRAAVSKLESKPAEAAAPFAGDAWAAALATTAQEKITGAKEHAVETAAPVDANATVIEPVPQSAEPAGPANWASVTDTPWELEAKKASLLAATWDAPAPSMPPSAAAAEGFLQEEPAAAVSEASSTVVNEFVEQGDSHGTTEYRQEQRAEANEAPAAAVVGNIDELPALDFSAQEAVTESAYASSAPAEANETQEALRYREAEANIVSQAVAPAAEEPVHAAEPVEEVMHHAEPAAAEHVDMEALVARVVAKMNPDVLQRVTQEILKPVIEALIKDELASKK
jgi:hypothetical protein